MGPSENPSDSLTVSPKPGEHSAVERKKHRRIYVLLVSGGQLDTHSCFINHCVFSNIGSAGAKPYHHMKYKTRIASTILGLVLVLTGSKANAIPISDERIINAELNSASPTYDSVANNNSFDLTLHGFVPGPQTISWAYASFSFLDLDSVLDMVTISLDSSLASGLPSPIGFSVFGGLVLGTVLADLNTSGTLDYTVTMSGNSAVTLKGASLFANVTGNAPVPDGGSTLALLGCAMLGLGWARKKLIA